MKKFSTLLKELDNAKKLTRSALRNVHGGSGDDGSGSGSGHNPNCNGTSTTTWYCCNGSTATLIGTMSCDDASSRCSTKITNDSSRC